MVMQSILSKINARRLIIACMIIVVSICYVGCQKKAENQEVTVFAASSLNDAVMDITNVFESTNEDIIINVSTAGSKTLRSQLENGASADIFISANEKHYKDLLDQGILTEGKKILTNELVLVVSKDASDRIKTLEDLKSPHKLILGEEGVPVGDYSRKAIKQLCEKYGKDYEETVLNSLVSSESNVRQVLMKVVLGEGDAAIVYKTDITEDIKDDVTVIEIPKEYNVTASYWIGLVKGKAIPECVRSCYAHFSEMDSCTIFERYGFCVVK